MVINSAYVKCQIEIVKQRIVDKENEINRLKKELELRLEELKKIEEYENGPIENRTLHKYIFDTSSTVRLMDEFESITEEGYQRYKRLVLKNLDFSDCGGYHFIIERLNGRETKGNITMTNYKKGNNRELLNYANEQIVAVLEDCKEKHGKEIIFTKPYLLRAQNTSNRTGYGSEYNGDFLVHQGTLYGETTRYAFVGVIME